MTIVKDFFKTFEIFIEKSVKLTEGLKVSYKWLQKTLLNQKLKKIIKQEMLNVKNIDDNFATKNVPKKIKKVKKKIIKAPDESFKILLNMIMGIQIAVQATPNYKINENEDISKYLNSMLYSIQTTNLVKINPEIFFLKEYGGIIFNNIRLLNGFDKDKFIMSISPQDFITELMISSQTIFEELCSTGKSGSLFYYTRDGNFIVKTIAKCEYKFLKKILPNYYLHLKNNPLSLLPKFFGCYQLIRKYKKSKNKINFIVMMNVFKTSRYIHIRFDLKGSKIGRKVLTNNKKKNEDILKQGDLALKDLDLEENNIKTFIGKNKSELFFNQLKKDVDFLCNVGSIDYSLLLGIHYINRENKTKKKKISKMKSVICKCKSNKDLAKSDINNNNNNFRRNNMLHKTKTLAAKKISMNSAIVTNGNDNFFNTYNNKLSFTDINNNNNNNNNKINNIINNNENINNIINTNEINNNNNNENINNKSESLDEDFLSIFEDDDKSYKERLEEVHKLFNFDDGGIISENGNEIIFLGIIDILTEYNCKKSTEHFFKMIRYCSNDMSCVNPIYYKDRFFNYMKKVIMHGDPNIKNKFNKLYYQETTTDNEIKNQFISNDINNNVKGNDVDIFE